MIESDKDIRRFFRKNAGELLPEDKDFMKRFAEATGHLPQEVGEGNKTETGKERLEAILKTETSVFRRFRRRITRNAFMSAFLSAATLAIMGFPDFAWMPSGVWWLALAVPAIVFLITFAMLSTSVAE